jgi:hypothetical protein
MPNFSSITKLPTSGPPYTGVEIVWNDSRGTRTYRVEQLPGNLRTVADVNAFLNAIVEQVEWYDGTAPRTRIGQFFDCFAYANCTQFTRNVSADIDMVASDYPFFSNPYTP